MLSGTARRIGHMVTRLMSRVLVTIIVASTLAAVGVLAGQAAGKWRIAPVLSGSMAPSFDQGDLVMAEPIDKAALRPGDVLLFNAPIEGSPAVVHRISARTVVNGEPVFNTKGDANKAPDVWTIRVNGESAWRVTHVLPMVGRTIAWLDNSALRLSILVIGVGTMLFGALRSVWALAPISWHAERVDRRRKRQLELHSTHRAVALGVGGLVGVAVLGMMGLAYAQFTSTPTPPAPGFTSGSLAASSPLSCTWASATTIALGWANNSPTFATGYSAQRSDTSGSGYAQVGTTSPATVITYTDTPPAPQTTKRYYVVDATRGTWSSPHSNEVASNDCIGAINLVAGTTTGFSGDTGPATAAQLATPLGVTVDASGNVYIADALNNRIRKVDAATGVITTIAGGGASTGCAFAGTATSATLNQPRGVAIDTSGNIYISDTGNNCVRKVTNAGAISLYAGTGANAACTYAGTAVSTSIGSPRGLAVDASGNLFITDATNNCVRKVTAGNVSQVAGGGANTVCTYAGAASAVSLSQPNAVALNAAGDVFIADTSRNCIRKVTAGNVSQVAGGGASGACSFAGAATAVALTAPSGVAVDSLGRVVIADSTPRCLRMVSAGNVSQFAGTGTSGSTGDNGPAIAALLTTPNAVTANASGDVWVADAGSHRVRRVEGPR